MRSPLLKTILGTALLVISSSSALALPKMDIASAKATLYKRSSTPTAREFNNRRVKDLPAFDKLGIGNYYALYQLDQGKKLQIWMYVESGPPEVDEVLLRVSPASPADVTPARAAGLLNLVYGESLAGSRVIEDFKTAQTRKIKNQYRMDTKTYQHGSLIPTSFDGGLYYVGNNYGYKVTYHKGGFEITVQRKEYLEKWVMDTKKRKYPDPLPPAKPTPTPPPAPTPRPAVRW